MYQSKSELVTMRNRVSQQPFVHNGREAVLFERRRQGDCTWCPPNRNENENGRHSLWGRKVAAKRKYATGKGRKEINWYKYGPWNLYDRHYDPNYSPGGHFHVPVEGTHYYW